MEMISILTLLFITASWIGGNFQKVYKTRNNSEVVSGSFYKPIHGAVSFVVDTPVHQIITFRQDTMIVYYPDRKVAFKIRSVEDAIQRSGFNGSLKESIDALRKGGYIFLKKKINGDTIYSYWTHDKLKTTVLVVYDKKNRVYKVRVENEKGALLYETLANGYISIDDTTFFPTELKTITPKDTEIFMFSHVSLIKPDSLPTFLKNPVIPDSVKVILKNFDEK